MKRAAGYYWVIDGKSVPEVAEWSEGHWWLSGCDEAAYDEQIVVLGERLAPPSTPDRPHDAERGNSTE